MHTHRLRAVVTAVHVQCSHGLDEQCGIAQGIARGQRRDNMRSRRHCRAVRQRTRPVVPSHRTTCFGNRRFRSPTWNRCAPTIRIAMLAWSLTSPMSMSNGSRITVSPTASISRPLTALAPLSLAHANHDRTGRTGRSEKNVGATRGTTSLSP